MKRTYPRIVLAVMVMAGFQLAACSDSKPKHVMIHPAHVEAIEGSDLHTVELTTKAMERLNVETAPVLIAKGGHMQNGHNSNGHTASTDGKRSAQSLSSAILTKSGSGAAPGSASMKIVPYAALIYDASGNTWVYTSPQPQQFVRSRVVVDYIEGDQAMLSEGPPVGTLVATQGVAEIYGTEFEVGH